MKKSLLFIPLILLLACSGSHQEEQHDKDQHEDHEATAQESAKEEAPLSPRKASMANIGDNHVHIDYSSPGKRGRIIFGGLVGYDQVWVTGAHKATNINFSTNVNIGGVEIPSGKYGLFTIPGEQEWTIIINKDWDMHLADDYDMANDMVRVNVPVQELDEIQESLNFEVEEIDANSGLVKISWDQTQVAFEVRNSLD